MATGSILKYFKPVRLSSSLTTETQTIAMCKHMQQFLILTTENTEVTLSYTIQLQASILYIYEGVYEWPCVVCTEVNTVLVGGWLFFTL